MATMTGRKIKDILFDIRLVLLNGHGMNADIGYTFKGVPYVVVKIFPDEYRLVFFGRTRLFRVFSRKVKVADFTDRNDVIKWFIEKKED